MKRFENILDATESEVVLEAFHHAVDLVERNKARLTVILVTDRIPSYLTRLTPPILQQVWIKEQKGRSNRSGETN